MSSSNCQENEWDFATKATHVGQDPAQWSSRAIIPPIVLSTTFHQLEPGVTSGYEYGRSGNPTRSSLEQCIAALENGQFALAFSSGLAAQTNITFLLQAGDHIIANEELYGGTNRLFRTCSAQFGLTTDFVDFRQINKVLDAIKPNTKLIWFESPTNPLLKVIDVAQVCRQIKKNRPDIIIVVDNTFLSPYFQKPLNYGADISMNSVTKYMNGHSDVIMGCISTNEKSLYERLKYLQNAIGAVPSPLDCFLVNRGLKTLAIRMQQHEINAMAVAQFLEKHSAVVKVYYPGLKSHPQHGLAKTQATGYGGMISFELKGTLQNSRKLLATVKIFLLGESLGAVESLIEIPSIMTHASIPEESREKLGIKDTLIRLSVGIENAKDLIQDLDQALLKSQQIF